MADKIDMNAWMEMNFCTFQDLANCVQTQYDYSNKRTGWTHDAWMEKHDILSLAGGVDVCRNEIEKYCNVTIYNVRLRFYGGKIKNPLWEIKCLYDHNGKKHVLTHDRNGVLKSVPYAYDHEIWNKIISDMDNAPEKL